MHHTPIHGHNTATKTLLIIVGALARVALNPATFILRTARQSRVRVAVMQGNQVLLIKSITHPYTWDLPGGGYDKNESGEECAARELHEELRLNLATNELYSLGTIDQPKWLRVWHYDCLRAELPSNTHSITPNYEILDAEWFAINALPATITPYAKTVLTTRLTSMPE